MTEPSRLAAAPIRAAEVQAGDILAAPGALGSAPHTCLVTLVERDDDEHVTLYVLDSPIFEVSKGQANELPLKYDDIDVLLKVVTDA